MREKPLLFLNEFLSSEYSAKVFREHNYDYFVNLEEKINNEEIPISYLNCESPECYNDYIEPTPYKPDILNENLFMAARHYIKDYYGCGKKGER
jgi:hypothetical protein